MKNGRRKLQICLLGIVVLAVILGFCYYYGESVYDTDKAEGTLVKQEETYGC